MVLTSAGNFEILIAMKKRKGIAGERVQVEKVQTGLRMEKRIVKVLKALAEYYDMTPGDLLEGILLHVFEGKTPFSKESLKRIEDLKRIYDLNLDASMSHRLDEKPKLLGPL
jgi:hypothetical protein